MPTPHEQNSHDELLRLVLSAARPELRKIVRSNAHLASPAAKARLANEFRGAVERRSAERTLLLAEAQAELMSLSPDCEQLRFEQKELVCRLLLLADLPQEAKANIASVRGLLAATIAAGRFELAPRLVSLTRLMVDLTLTSADELPQIRGVERCWLH